MHFLYLLLLLIAAPPILGDDDTKFVEPYVTPDARGEMDGPADRPVMGVIHVPDFQCNDYSGLCCPGDDHSNDGTFGNGALGSDDERVPVLFGCATSSSCPSSTLSYFSFPQKNPGDVC